MRDKHTQPEWHCWYCKTVSSSSTSFLTPEELGRHLETKHQNEVTDLLRPTLVKHSMIRPNHALEECPFCGEFPKEIEKDSKFEKDSGVEKDSAERDQESASEKLEKHVKDHLVSVALILAPMKRGEPAGQFNNTQSEAQRDCQSERDLIGVGDQYELECSNSSCDCKTRSGLDFEQNVSPAHDASEDVQAFWDIESLWKQLRDEKERKFDDDPSPPIPFHQDSLPKDSSLKYSLSESSSLHVFDLAEYINNALRESEFPTPQNGYFAPKSTLNGITNSSVTHTIWSNSKSFSTLVDSDKKLVEFISGQAREIFAIGIYMDIHDQNLRNMMRLFMMHDKSDKSLPIPDADMQEIWPGVRYEGRRRSFQDSQHLFRAQEFPMRDGFSVIKLESKVVLPIYRSEHVSQGQFGMVYKVTLHEEFLDFNDPIRKVRRNICSSLPDTYWAQETARLSDTKSP